ncbi:ribosomal protein L32 [Metarhizium guizhouense ARSEF 977]|uniref:Ribosomal protein L32 n=1 Tax=Metarhizium guizhouense (strain ARSEF 977) TaxID=1276136 RepID=A0A0B4H3J9_METGA|nr:ribosomal protein L32 [Metarhizium guizhouense ARSEF 977]
MTATASSPAAPPPTTCCPGCGLAAPPPPAEADLALARQKIAQLESTIHDLNAQASDAARRRAQSDEELHALRAQQHQRRPSTPQRPPSQPCSPAATTATTTTTQSPTLPSRLSALLYPRKSTPSLRADARRQNSLPPPPPPEDLMEALAREQTLRREAEGRLSATSREVEELSASLFEQANEMVAAERRARARLEEHVGELERRDDDKRRRLDRLEAAMARIERVRSILDK